MWETVVLPWSERELEPLSSDSHSRTFTDSYSRDINVFGSLDFVFDINSVVCVST